MRRLAAFLVLVVVLLVAAAAYTRIGWWRMEYACSAEDGTGPTHARVSYSWSWSPPGFTCTYGDGTSETSLWF